MTLIAALTEPITMHAGRHDKPRPAGTIVTADADALDSDSETILVRDAERPRIIARVYRNAIRPA